jgi:hypothetical protein
MRKDFEWHVVRIGKSEGGVVMRILDFPKNRSQRAEKAKRAEARQAVLSLSIISLIMGAVLLNDALVARQRPTYLVSDNMSPTRLQQLNRAIASAQPMNPFRDLEWEKRMAEKLAARSPQDARTPASVSRHISALDDLRYGFLAGNYRLVDEQGEKHAGINEIEYVDPVDVTSKPVFIEPEIFLQKYGALLAVDFDKYKPTVQENSTKEYELMKDEKVVGRARFQLDGDGKFLRLKVRTASLSQ